MYFAAGLFLSTGLVGVVISLVSAPPRDYMLVRTTFITRLDGRERPDEQQGSCEAGELQPLADKLQGEISQSEFRRLRLTESSAY